MRDFVVCVSWLTCLEYREGVLEWVPPRRGSVREGRVGVVEIVFPLYVYRRTEALTALCATLTELLQLHIAYISNCWSGGEEEGGGKKGSVEGEARVVTKEGRVRKKGKQPEGERKGRISQSCL